MKKLTKLKIVGARKTNDDLRQKIYKYKQAIQAYTQCKEEVKNSDKLKENVKAATKIFSAIKDQFPSNDQEEGMTALMRRFFPENGFYRLKMEDKFLPGEDKFIPEGKEANKMTTTLDNEETRRKMYHEVLRIFASLD